MMDIPKELYNDPRFIEVVRELRKRVRLREPPPPSPDEPGLDDEVTRRVQAKINLRMKQRKTKQR